jgi:hypothetical protein
VTGDGSVEGVPAALFLGGTHESVSGLPGWHLLARFAPIAGSLTVDGDELRWSPRRPKQWLPREISTRLEDVQQVDFSAEGRYKTATIRYLDGQQLVLETDGTLLRRTLEAAGMRTVERDSWRRRWIAARAGDEVEWPDGSRSVAP